MDKIYRKYFVECEMIEEVGSGAVAVYMQAAAASKVKAEANIESARPEISETRTEERGEVHSSMKAVEVQLSSEAKQIAADPRQEKPMQA